MNKLISVLLISLAGVWCLSASAAPPPRPLPQGLFACHVVTVDDYDGIVFVQADNRERARVVAEGSEAFVAEGRRMPAHSVIECVRRFAGDFDSPAANTLRDSLVL